MTATHAAPALRSLQRTLLRLRARVLPEELELGWTPFYVLGYLLFLYMPIVFGGSDSTRYFGGRITPAAVGLTLASTAAFLPLYFASYRTSGWRALACTLGIAAIACALTPFNVFSNTYVIYAAGAAATMGGSLRWRLGWLALLLAVYLLELVVLGYPLFVFALTVIIGVAVFIGNHLYLENRRKRAELRLSHDEVRRLAAYGERERIGRDLHDLLGHTLSMVALKSELAGKLLARDPQAARREIDEVAHVARDALAQVRRAVSGIRAAGLAAELASARLLLESDGVSFHYRLAELALPAEVETTLALAVREAVTNIQRHARAAHATVVLEAARAGEALEALLRIEDDGRGGAIVPGNGLGGMRERIEALGGSLRIDARVGQGSCVEVRLPLPGGPAGHRPA